MSSNESDPSIVTDVKAAPIETLQQRAFSGGWATIVALAGGAACGWCISKFAEWGSVSLWALGFVAGLAARRLQLEGRFSAWALAIACFVAYAVAETCWLRWNTKNGEEGWWASICLWPMFLNEYTVSALIGAAFAAFGAESAFRQARRPSGSAS